MKKKICSNCEYLIMNDEGDLICDITEERVLLYTEVEFFTCKDFEVWRNS